MNLIAHIKKDLLLILTVISVVAGIGIGLLLREITLSQYVTYLISIPGEIMMRLLKMLILPLIVFSVMNGVTSLSTTSSGKMGLLTILFYFTTTTFAVILGVIVTLVIHPGDPKALPDESKFRILKEVKGDTSDALIDMLRNLFPSNIVKAAFTQTRTMFAENTEMMRVKNQTLFDEIQSNTSILVSRFNLSATTKESHWPVYYNVAQKTLVQTGTEEYSGTNVLGLIFFAIGMSLCMLKMGKKAQPLIEIISICNDVIMKFIMYMMWYTPIGIFFLIVQNVIKLEDLQTTAETMGMFIFTVVLALSIHFFLILTPIYFVFVRKNPLVFLRNLLPAIMTAFGTASSSATLPMTFHCMEEKNKIDKRVTRFVLPIGATVNMDGTALYEGLCALFIAQMNDYTLDIGQILTIIIISIVASVGAASIPSAGLVTMVLVFESVGLPVEQIAMIYTVDWFLDRFRTAVNITGDSIGAAIVAKLCGKNVYNSEEREMINSKL